MKNLLIAGAVLISVAGQSCFAAPAQESSIASKHSFAKENGGDDPSVTEIQLVDTNQTIILQSDGSAIRYDLGSSSAWKKADPKQANYQQGQVNPNDYAMLVKLINKANFFTMEDYLPSIFSGIDFATSVKKNGKTHQVRRMSYEELEFRKDAFEGPLALWGIERAILGVSSSIQWEKDTIRVRGVVHIKAMPSKVVVGDRRVVVAAQSVKDANFNRQVYIKADGTFQILLPTGDYKLIAQYYDVRQATMQKAEQLVLIKDSEMPRLSFTIDEAKPTAK